MSRMPWIDLEGYYLSDEVYAFVFYDQSGAVPRAPYDFPEGSVFYFRARNTGRYPGRPDASIGPDDADLVKRSDGDGASASAPLAWVRENRTLYLYISAEDTRFVNPNVSGGSSEASSFDWEMDAVVPGRGRQTIARGSLTVHPTLGLNDPEIVGQSSGVAP